MHTYIANRALTWVQGPCPAHVSALLAIYVCAYSTLIYVISFRKTTNYSKSAGPPCGGHQAAKAFLIVSLLLSLYSFKFS